jgi:hypothetical protein
MRKELATFKALISGGAKIEYIDKTSVKKTPGEVTEEVSGHQ